MVEVVIVRRDREERARQQCAGPRDLHARVIDDHERDRRFPQHDGGEVDCQPHPERPPAREADRAATSR